MAVIHITDKVIQEFLDNQLSAVERSRVEAHLQECPVCSAHILQYRSIYRELHRDEGFELSARFEKRVMRQIQRDSLGALHHNLWYAFLAFCGIIIGLNISLYFVDLKNYTNIFGNFSRTKISLDFVQNFSFVSDFREYLSGLNLNFGFIILPLAVLVLIAVVDYFINHAKQRILS